MIGGFGESLLSIGPIGFRCYTLIFFGQPNMCKSLILYYQYLKTYTHDLKTYTYDLKTGNSARDFGIYSFNCLNYFITPQPQ